MKYCPKCKLRVPVEATTCHKCGGPLRSVGGGSATGSGPAGESSTAQAVAEPDLSMQLQGLQHEVRRSRSRLVFLGSLALVLSAALVVLLIGLRLHHVNQYAEVDQFDVHLSEHAKGEAAIKFVRRDPGKVEFIRESADRTETLIDHGNADAASQATEQQFVWSGGAAEDFTLRIRTRSGWSLTETVWTARDGKIRKGD